MHSAPLPDSYGNLESWFDLLRNLGAHGDLTRGQMAEATGTNYNTLCRLLRRHLIPMGIVEMHGHTPDDPHYQGRPTDTYRMTPRGKALLAAIEHVEQKFGNWFAG